MRSSSSQLGASGAEVAGLGRESDDLLGGMRFALDRLDDEELVTGLRKGEGPIEGLLLFLFWDFDLGAMERSTRYFAGLTGKHSESGLTDGSRELSTFRGRVVENKGVLFNLGLARLALSIGDSLLTLEGN